MTTAFTGVLNHSGADNCATEEVLLYAAVECIDDNSLIAGGQVTITVYPAFDASLLTLTTGDCATIPTATTSCGNYVVNLDGDTDDITTAPMPGESGTNNYTITWASAPACWTDGTATVAYNCAAVPNFEAGNSFNPNDPCSCNDNQTGNGNQDGTFAETVSVTGDPGDIIAGQMWTVTGITPLSGSAMPTLSGGGAVVPNTTTLTFDNSGAEPRYFLDIEHTDDNGYFITIEGPAAVGTIGNTVVQISNLCEYPEISPITGVSASYSINDASTTSTMITEVSSPTNTGTVAYTISPALPSGFTDNGDGTFTFDPAPGDEGNYIITGTFTPTAPFSNMSGTAAAPAYPGDACETIETFSLTITSGACSADNGNISISVN